MRRRGNDGKLDRRPSLIVTRFLPFLAILQTSEPFFGDAKDLSAKTSTKYAWARHLTRLSADSALAARTFRS